MRAERYNAVLSCPVCETGDCQLCSDDGEFSFFAPAHPAESDRDVIIYHADRDNDGHAEMHMMNVSRFNGLFGDLKMEPPTDADGNLTIAQDKADRMQNQLGENAPYGNGLSKNDFPNGWPSDSDLSPQEVIAWLEARGNKMTADKVQIIISTLGL